MRIVTVGASHGSASLQLLESLSVAPGELDSILGSIRPLVGGAFVLSTCNRTEIYAVVDDDSGITALVDLLRRRASHVAATRTPDDMLYVHEADHAVRHALRVASGLDSMVLGEDQIQAQVKRALSAARGAEMLDATLERLGATALGCGKRVRAFTGVGQHSVSLESLAVDAGLARFGALRQQHAVVLGSGSSAGVVVRQLRQHGATVTIVGRTSGAAAALATEAGAACFPWERLPEALEDARVVFCCTSAPHPVLDRHALAQRLAARGAAPLLCIDLGMPRDVHPDVSTLEGVTVVSLDELGRVAAAHRGERAKHLPEAEAIVERETDRFMAWLRSRVAAPVIASARARAQALADAELNRALARLQTANAHDRTVVAELARRLARKLMHDSTEELKLETLLAAAPEDHGIIEREEAAS